MPHLNVEIKAICHTPSVIEQILKEKNAIFIGEDHQIDTYFNVPNGRLKLREGSIENALIHYERDNQSGPKQSHVTLYKSAPDSLLKALLTKANGILTVVDKKRKIFFIENVKFHIDEVRGLGLFVEIEAIDNDPNQPNIERRYSYAKLLEQCQYYIQLFKIADEDLLTHSYSDMLLVKSF